VGAAGPGEPADHRRDRFRRVISHPGPIVGSGAALLIASRFRHGELLVHPPPPLNKGKEVTGVHVDLR